MEGISSWRNSLSIELRNEFLELRPPSSEGIGDYIFDLFNALQELPFLLRRRERMAEGLAGEVFGIHVSRQLAIEGAWLTIENQGRQSNRTLA